MTKEEVILEHLKNGYEITPLQASRPPFNTMYLASYIRNIIKRGYDIRSKRIKNRNYNIYYLFDKKEDKNEYTT